MQTKVIYEDNHIIVIHKPAGLATQTAHIGQQDVVSELKNYLAGREGRGSVSSGKTSYLGVIHRLDQPVEGLLVFAKSKEAAAKLTKQVSTGTLNKQYYAVVCGKLSESSGRLVDYLIKEGNTGRIGKPQEKEAKRAVLEYTIKKELGKDCSLADICIETGRFHQIRLQMAHAGHPILGDLKYGTPESVEMSRRYQVRNVALYAYRLEFPHPVTREKMEFVIDPKLPISLCE